MRRACPAWASFVICNAFRIIATWKPSTPCFSASLSRASSAPSGGDPVLPRTWAPRLLQASVSPNPRRGLRPVPGSSSLPQPHGLNAVHLLKMSMRSAAISIRGIKQAGKTHHLALRCSSARRKSSKDTAETASRLSGQCLLHSLRHQVLRLLHIGEGKAPVLQVKSGN